MPVNRYERKKAAGCFASRLRQWRLAAGITGRDPVQGGLQLVLRYAAEPPERVHVGFQEHLLPCDRDARCCISDSQSRLPTIPNS